MQNAPNTPRAARPAKPKPPAPPAEFQEGAIEKMDSAALIRVLKDPKSTEFHKAKACQRAAEVGTSEAVPALTSLLADEHLSTYARYGLEALPGPEADEALRNAVPKLSGNLLIGVLNSIGKRGDEKSGPVVSKLVYSNDPEIAKAAASALGKISGVAAMKELQAALGKTTGPVRSAVADAGLLCAEGLMAKGLRTEGLAMYTALTAPDIPKPMRLAAMHGIIGAETSVTRPR